LESSGVRVKRILNQRRNQKNMGTKIPADRIYHSDKVLAGIPQLLDDFSQLIDDQETGNSF
jgi:hypothetical protein